MPPKTKSTVVAKTIRKRPQRPGAAAAVKAAATGLLPRPRRRGSGPPNPPVSPSPEQSHAPSDIGIGSTNDRLDALELTLRAIIDSLDKVRERHDELHNSINTMRTGNTGTTHVGEMTPATLNGMKPAEAIQLYMPWVDATTLTSVVAGTLDVQQFIKLVPPEHRPRGQANLGLATGSHTDFATGKISLVNESTVTFEKIYPDYPTLAMALGVYLAIRALYDTDNLGFGCAIGLYMRQLALWSKHHNWAAIMAYFVAHFRKHQPSPDPRVWMDVDVQLFTMYVTIDTLKSPRVPVTAATTTEVCNKWNSDKGCHWSRCLRKHICSLCKGDHTALHCSSRTPASKQS